MNRLTRKTIIKAFAPDTCTCAAEREKYVLKLLEAGFPLTTAVVMSDGAVDKWRCERCEFLTRQTR